MTAARFTDRNVLVTGAAQGIGRGIAEAFLAEGARVFAADIQGDTLERMRSEQPDPTRVDTDVVDLSDFDAAIAMAQRAVTRLGRIHVLVNCAGVMPDGPLAEVTRQTFDLTFAVNVRAPMATMQVVGSHMAEHGGGAIVNIASANAFKNESPESVYNASKAALVALTKAAAHEWGTSRHPRELRGAGPDADAGGGSRRSPPIPTRPGCNASTCAGSRCDGRGRLAIRRRRCCSSRRTTLHGSPDRR